MQAIFSQRLSQRIMFVFYNDQLAWQKKLTKSIGFGEFEEASPRDRVTISVDHHISASHHREVLAWDDWYHAIVITLLMWERFNLPPPPVSFPNSPALFPSLSPKTPLKTVSPLGEITTRYETLGLSDKSSFWESFAKFSWKFSPRCRCSSRQHLSPGSRIHPLT